MLLGKLKGEKREIGSAFHEYAGLDTVCEKLPHQLDL